MLCTVLDLGRTVASEGPALLTQLGSREGEIIIKLKKLREVMSSWKVKGIHMIRRELGRMGVEEQEAVVREGL